MAWKDIIRLGSYHSIIIPNSIPIMGLDKLVERHSPTMQIESFGLFDTAAPNFVNYYPTVTAEDFNPQDGEFIYPVYRGLSEVVVHRNYNPVDFGQNGVLKKSMGLLVGQTVYPNHENLVGNELGSIPEVSWEQSYVSNGVRIPAGINVKMKLDAKSNPKIARAINMTPPAIHSSSVTVEFLWEKSHASMSEDEFWKKLGSFDQDGQMIRRVVTGINRYNEISLVTKGADPFAQKVGKDGAINNPTEAGIRDQQKGKLKMGEKFFFFDYQTELLQNSEDQNHTIPEEINNTETDNSTHQNENNMNKQFLLALAAVMGLTGDQYAEANITEDGIKAAVTSLSQQKLIIAKLNELTGITFKIEKPEDVTRLQEILTKYDAVKDVDVTALKEFQDSVLNALRADVTKAYEKLSDGKPNDAILAMIQNKLTSREVLMGLQVQYETQLNEKFPLKCSDCGSAAVSRGSAQKPEGAAGGEGTKTDTGKNGDTEEGKESLEDIIRKKQQENSLSMPGFQKAKK